MSYLVSIHNVVKKFGGFVAVNGVNLEIREGEFFTLLGPSGCGKTTLLRMIAGFSGIDEGEIRFNNRVINNVPPHKRDTAMVFQNYAVFPHLTVSENVAYGLKARKVPKEQILDRVANALELVQISSLKDRLPSELSGGQQQRVALARAFVVEPGLLLMDEPLSNLDAKLRVQMRTEIKKLQKRLGITTIYVTHDQEEALAVSDRIAVMKGGALQQVGKPEEIYRSPQKLFVAGFIGNSNQFRGSLEMAAGEKTGRLTFDNGYACEIPASKNYSGAVTVSVRPEHMTISSSGVPAKIMLATFLGDYVEYEAKLEDGSVINVNEYSGRMDRIHSAGENVFISFDSRRIAVYDGNEEVI